MSTCGRKVEDIPDNFVAHTHTPNRSRHGSRRRRFPLRPSSLLWLWSGSSARNWQSAITERERDKLGRQIRQLHKEWGADKDKDKDKDKDTGTLRYRHRHRHRHHRHKRRCKDKGRRLLPPLPPPPPRRSEMRRAKRARSVVY